jgi:chemotaxis protein MotA
VNVVVGLLGLVALLAYTLRVGHSGAFEGVVYGPALVLLGFAPLCMVLTSYRFEDLGRAARALVRALGFSSRSSRAALFEELSRFATEVRQRNAAQALAVAEGARHALLRQLGPLVVSQYSASELERTAETATFCCVSGIKRSESVFQSLAKVAPAAGLIGTVLGLIALLKDLSRFEQLGPSMALALLCTLYGLLLANALYLPLARLIHSHAVAMVEESRLLTRALVLVREGKPLADVRALFDEEAASARGAAAPALGLEGGR